MRLLVVNHLKKESPPWSKSSRSPSRPSPPLRRLRRQGAEEGRRQGRRGIGQPQRADHQHRHRPPGPRRHRRGPEPRAGRHLHALPHDAQFPLERDRAALQLAACDVHDASTPNCGPRRTSSPNAFVRSATTRRARMPNSARSRPCPTCRRRRPRRWRWCASWSRATRPSRASRANSFRSPTEAGDDPTADMLTARCTVHDQTAWMLRSLLED